MSVNWYWKWKVGEIIYFAEEEHKRWKLQMFGGNVMCAFIYRYKKLDEETGKLEKYYNFFTFFNDIDHAKRCLKDDKTLLYNMALGKHKLRKIKLCISSNSKYRNKKMLQLAKLLVKYNYKVELY